jgi:hypothetical protein
MSAYLLTLASPHDDAVDAYRHWKKSGGDMHWRLAERLRDLGLYRKINHSYQKPPSPWVADVTEGGRDFLQGSKTYPDKEMVGETCVSVTYLLEPGRTYEINKVVRLGLSKRAVRQVSVERYFAKVVGGELVPL